MNIDAALARVLTAPVWPPQGRTVTSVPDWAEHFIHWGFQIANRDLSSVDAYIESPEINAGVRMLMEDCASVPCSVFRGFGDKRTKVERKRRLVDDGGNLADLLAYANPTDTGRQLRASTAAHLVLNGNAFWYLQRFSPMSPPSEIWLLPAQLVRVVPGFNRSIKGYEFQRGGSGAYEYIDARDVIHFRRFNPKDEPIGRSDLCAVKQAYEAQWFALQWVREFFRKGAVIPGIWSTETGVPTPTPEEIDAIRARFRKQYLGIDNAWEVVIISGLKYVAAGMKLSEMELDKQIALIEAKLLRALGIPPWMLGIKEGSNLGQSGANVDERIYWLGTVGRTLSLIDDVITEKLCPLFGNDLSIESDIRSVLAIQGILLEQAKTHLILAGNKTLESRNEARVSIGREETDNPEDDELSDPTPPPGFGADPDSTDEVDKESKGDRAEKKKAKNSRAWLAEETEAPAEDHHAELRRTARVSLAKYRDRVQAVIVARVEEQRASAKERVRAVAQTLGLGRRLVVLAEVDIEALLGDPESGDEEKIAKILASLIEERGREALASLERSAGVSLEVVLDLTTARSAAFIRKQVDRAIRVPDKTTKKILRDSIADGIAQREGLTELVARIDAVFDGRRDNALTIARTETLPAYNFGALEAWAQSGIVEKSMWLTSRSGLGGRHSENPEGRYDDLDGQVRALGEAFDVGGVSMMYPGDPDGPAGESINCVCTVQPFIEAAALRRLKPSTNGNGHAERTPELEAFLAEVIKR